MESSKYPIITRGELYIESITKKGGGGPKKYPHQYDEAKPRIIADIDNIYRAIQEKQEVFLNEKVVCVRMEPKFEAKSYVPTQLTTTNDGMSIIGGRKYSYKEETKDQDAKLYFIKTDDEGINSLKETLTSGIKDNVDAWRHQIESIHSIDLLKPEEKIMGFPDEWQKGTVEIILHPLDSEYDKMLELFYSISKIPEKNARVKTYKDGLTFISAKCSRAEVENIKRFNPLRAVHPLGRIDLTPIRMVPGGSVPQLLTLNKKSSVIVGVFDGGVVDTHPLLNGHITATDYAQTPSDQDCLSHGTAVCGTVLHGNLAGKNKSDTLPPPSVSIEAYRVFPIREEDPQLYEIIDIIESVVENRSDIKLYNLSFGPYGAIIDDSINRFTYVLDKLTYESPENATNPLFCIAVGNAGDLDEPENRVQSPSDMVNGLGIGAYTYGADGFKVRAQYSCVGSGREGAKVKPDFLDFGGSDDHPFGLVGLQLDSLSMASGTSFASPCSVNKIGKLMAKSENIVPHLGRTLLIHNAKFNKLYTRKEQGHGFCPTEVENMLFCDDKKVVVMYSGVLKPSQTVNLPIFSPNISSVKGRVSISWTITAIVAPYANDPDAYTNDCITDVFIPHDETFYFYKEDPKTQEIERQKLNLRKETDAAQVDQLISEGYRQSELPASYSPKYFWKESDLRAGDLKWDTVIKKRVRMNGSSLHNPFLTLQAIDRNNFNASNIKYHVVVSIEAPNYQGNLYDAILKNYTNLVPIKIRDINRIMVDIR